MTGYHERKKMLEMLYDSICRHEKDIASALRSDLGKSEQEAYMTETGVLKDEIKFLLRHLRHWMKPQRGRTTLKLFPSRCYRIPEPYGKVLIIAPWNYPLLLTLEPLCGAIAAGNTVVLKPSENAPATASVVTGIIREALPEETCRIFRGGRDEGEKLLDERYDYIFFTGSSRTGKKILSKAAEHLTPASLELGGKSPVLVAEDADLDITARRIVFGKFMNAGQTCVAPDYVLAPSGTADRLIEKLCYWTDRFYGQDIFKEPCPGNEYAHIINRGQFDRLLELIPKEGDKEKTVRGGHYNPDTLHIEPTIIRNVDFDSRIMEEEIFGPLLPVLTYEKLEDAVSLLKKKEKPLALYLFTGSRKTRKYILEELPFGGGCINDTLVHVGTSTLPFGGVGNSGMGAYHGKASFDTFTHYKSIVHKSILADPAIRNRPYTEWKLRLLRKL